MLWTAFWMALFGETKKTATAAVWLVSKSFFHLLSIQRHELQEGNYFCCHPPVTPPSESGNWSVYLAWVILYESEKTKAVSPKCLFQSRFAFLARIWLQMTRHLSQQQQQQQQRSFISQLIWYFEPDHSYQSADGWWHVCRLFSWLDMAKWSILKSYTQRLVVTISSLTAEELVVVHFHVGMFDAMETDDGWGKSSPGIYSNKSWIL